MHQFTLRQIPQELFEILKKNSQKSGRSINKTILALLRKTLGLSDDLGQKKRDLSSLAGTWTKKNYEEFEANTKIFDQIDPEMWK